LQAIAALGFGPRGSAGLGCGPTEGRDGPFCANRVPATRRGVDLFSLLRDTAARDPGRTALIDGAHTASYAEAHAAAERLAAALAQRGVGPGDRVACLAHNSADCFFAYFAAARLGAILVPLNTRLLPEELQPVLRHAEARLLVADDAHGALAAALAPALPGGIASFAELRTANAEVPSPAPIDAATVAQLYYTSGTTGQPKGVMLTHGNVGRHARAAVRELSLAGTDRWAHIAPMFHLADAWAVFAVTLVGGVHVFLPRFTAPAALDLLADQAITITNLVPTMLNLMVKEPDAGRRRFALRTMLSGGAPIAPAIVRQILATFGCDYVQTYGMTETSPYLTLSLLTDELRRLPPHEQLHWKCKTGRPFLGVELKVVAGDGTAVAADDRTVGEIRVRGATVTPGYWRDAAATRAAFDDDGFLRTGDLATIDAHGYVNIVDRIKDVIKTGGEAVYSTEVENVLYQHPAVLECAVFGTPDPVWGEAVTAAIVLRPGAHVTAAAIVAHCKDRIAGFKAPRIVDFRAALPKTGSGKIQKRLLRDTAAPRNPHATE
jgi:acyl-CoA synthetase (AMP-forming)/AMP-acid ligase II